MSYISRILLTSNNSVAEDDTASDMENDTEMSDLDNCEMHGRHSWTMPDINNLENSEDCYRNGGKRRNENLPTEQDLEYSSGDAQVRFPSGNNVDIKMPARTQGQMPVTETHQPTVPNHVPPTTNQMKTQPALPVIGGGSPVTRVNATDSYFTVDAPETQAGQKWKAQDLHSILAMCTCGHAVSEDEILQNSGIIMCQCAKCETGWVSQIVI